MKRNTLFLLSGIQGSGKDTFLKENSLDMFSLSMDELRKIYLQPIMSNNGEFKNNGEKNEFIYHIFIDALKSKMSMGGPIIVNNMNVSTKSVEEFKIIAEKYGYEIAIVDFGIHDLDFYLERNKLRPEYDKVPEFAIKKSYEEKLKMKIPNNIKIFDKNEFAKEMNKSHNEIKINANKYNKINFIGDLQGCAQTILSFLKEKNINKNELYVFLGDYIDRGIENAHVLKMIENFKNEENFIFLKGNHDENIIKYLLGENNIKGRISDIFNNETLPEIIKAGFNNDRLKEIYENLKDFVFIEYHDKIIFANHGGLSNIPLRPMLVSEKTYLSGSGNFSDNVDEIFNNNNINSNFIQIHGHRNDHNLPIQYGNSINLEGGIEYGEDLRIATLSYDGKNVDIKSHYIENKFYKKGVLKMNEIELNFNDEAKLSYQVEAETKTISELVDILRKHPMIKEMKSGTNKNISAFNFTREAFNDKKTDHFIDELVSHARGLFINTNTNKIIGRGFEKFFNLNEKEETNIEKLNENYEFPLTLYKKENGFFGLISYDEESDSLIFTSKSTIDGDFAYYFEKIAKSKFSKEELNKLKRYAQKYEINYIFEVMDVENDPHVIKYEKDEIVLLDIVKRDLKFKNVTYDTLVKFTEQFKNISCKERFATFKDEKSLIGFINSTKKNNNIKHEGFVVEDQNGKKFKIKTPYYSAWKSLRSNSLYFKKRYYNLLELINSPKRDSVLKGFQEEFETLPKRCLERMSSVLNNIGVENEELKQDIMTVYKKIMKEITPSFNEKTLYQMKDEYYLEKENKKVIENNKKSRMKI